MMTVYSIPHLYKRIYNMVTAKLPRDKCYITVCVGGIKNFYYLEYVTESACWYLLMPVQITPRQKTMLKASPHTGLL